MATVTVVNAERTLEIEATSIVAGEVNSSGHLILERHDGTPIDVGAVSGMQLDSGSSYSKVDAFTYVGDTDPGSVPDGSVWLDTNDPAGPYASSSQKGLVELATNAETLTGTDTERAVTPAGLASIPGVKVLTTNSITQSANAGSYPTGISVMTLGTSSGWTPNSGFGLVVTHKSENDRTTQIFYANASASTATPRSWIRHGVTGATGWTEWSVNQSMVSLTAASFTQTSLLSAYPLGWSRLYYTTATSTSWDFSGSAGEVLTFVDGTDFAKQTFTKHTGGATAPEMWFRTATAAGGWTAWQKILVAPGAWTSYTPTWTTQSGANTPSIGDSTVNCKWTKKDRKVDVRFEITFGATTNFGASPTTADNWQFSLPVAAADTNTSIGFLEMRLNNNDKVCMGRAKLYSTTGFRISIASGYSDGSTMTNTGDVDSISPMAWVSGSSLKGHFTYESAA